MPKGLINGVIVDIPEKNKIGSGGEGDIYIGDGIQVPVDKAIKIYNAAARRGEVGKIRAAKLQYMMKLVFHPAAIAPQQLWLDTRYHTPCGFVMNLIPADYKEIRSWGNRNYRKQHQRYVTPAIIARGFLKLWDFVDDFHAQGAIIGDFNDLNEMFQEDNDDPDMVVVDIDAAQIMDKVSGKYWPCPVITQDFGAPRFFRDVIDNADNPFIENILYEEQDDWYSFAANFFKCLTLAHPYGGTHPLLKTLPKRAKAGISVMHKDVIYPVIAEPLSILSDEMRTVFENFFDDGQRYVFPRNIIEDYVYYAENGKAVAKKVYKPAISAQVITLLQGFGTVVFVSVIGTHIKVITNNNGMAMFHEIQRDGTILRQVELFKWITSANYAFLGDLIFVSTSPESDVVMAIDIASGKPRGAFKTNADSFARGSRQFGTTPYGLYRITSSYLMRGEVNDGELFERALFPVATNQCRIHVDSNVDRLFGYNRSGELLESFLVVNGNRYEVTLTPLRDNEIIDRVIVRFANRTCLVLRVTQINGVTRIHIDEIDADNGHLIKQRVTSDIDLIDLMDDVPFGNGILSMEDDRLLFKT